MKFTPLAVIFYLVFPYRFSYNESKEEENFDRTSLPNKRRKGESL